MPSPYNLDLHSKCTECTVRAERLFCNMAPASVAAMESIKYTGVYPKGSLLFVEGGSAAWRKKILEVKGSTMLVLQKESLSAIVTV